MLRWCTDPSRLGAAVDALLTLPDELSDAFPVGLQTC
jgi:hypothetical protein